MSTVQTSHPSHPGIVAVVLRPGERVFVSGETPENFGTFFQQGKNINGPLSAKGGEVIAVVKNLHPNGVACKDLLFARRTRDNMGNVQFSPEIISDLADILLHYKVQQDIALRTYKSMVTYGDEVLVLHPTEESAAWLLTRDEAEGYRQRWIREKSNGQIQELYLFMSGPKGWFRHLEPDNLNDPNVVFTIRIDSGSGQIQDIRDNQNWHRQLGITFDNANVENLLRTQDILPTRFLPRK